MTHATPEAPLLSNDALSKPAPFIPVRYTQAELDAVRRVLVKELRTLGCAADPALTSALFKMVRANEQTFGKGGEDG